MDEAKLEATSLEEEQLQDLIGNHQRLYRAISRRLCRGRCAGGRVLKSGWQELVKGCPLSPNTLQGWVQGTVSQFFPDILVVEANFLIVKC